MQEVSSLYRGIISGNHTVETRVTIGDTGLLVTRQGDYISFGSTRILVATSAADGSSFERILDDNKSVYKVNGSEVFRIDASGAKVTGEIRATSGKIGGFDIQPNYLSYNGQTWGGTNTYGAYLGTSGLQLGKNFKVDMQGNLTAASGTFTGSVHAGNIQYGGSAGYLSGSGLSDYSISGGKVAGYTLSTAKFTSGVNTSLGAAFGLRSVNGKRYYKGETIALRAISTE